VAGRGVACAKKMRLPCRIKLVASFI